MGDYFLNTHGCRTKREVQAHAAKMGMGRGIWDFRFQFSDCAMGWGRGFGNARQKAQGRNFVTARHIVSHSHWAASDIHWRIAYLPTDGGDWCCIEVIDGALSGRYRRHGHGRRASDKKKCEDTIKLFAKLFCIWRWIGINY